MSSINRRAFARMMVLVSGLVFTAACSSDVPTEAAAPAPAQPRHTLSVNPYSYYVIRNVNSGKVMDVDHAGCCNGYIVHQWTYDGSTNQQWSIIDLGNGYYKIIARHSGKALDVESASQNNFAKIHQWTYDGSYNQQWSIEEVSTGVYKILARHSGKAAVVSGGANYFGSLLTDGVSVLQYTYSGAANHQWTIEPI